MALIIYCVAAKSDINYDIFVHSWPRSTVNDERFENYLRVVKLRLLNYSSLLRIPSLDFRPP